jgi:hypothetical protein
VFTVSEMNFSVCGALCALATAGSVSAPVQPRMTAAPAAAMDVRIFMIASCLVSLAAAQGMSGGSLLDP